MELTLGLALLAGLISFLSPCVLPVVPAYLGQLGATRSLASAGPPGSTLTMPSPSGGVAGGSRPGAWTFGTLPAAIAFVVGFGGVFTVVGIAVTAAVSPLRDNLPLLRQAGGVLLIVMGLNLMGILHLRTLARSWRPLDRYITFSTRPRRRGVLGGLVLGSVFAVGWTPCIGPTLGAILTMAALAPGQATALLLAYSVGLGIPFIALSLAVDRAPRLIRPLLRHGRAIEVIGGGLVVLMGFALLFDWLRIIAGTFRAWWPQV
jgi:cytochrome c-type biogenesis protein